MQSKRTMRIIYINTNANFTFICVFAELERNLISQRVKSGMQNAKTKGKKIGRPAVSAEDIPSVFYKHNPKHKKGKAAVQAVLPRF